MKRLPFARWTQRLNLAQRMSIAFCTIVLVVLIAALVLWKLTVGRRVFPSFIPTRWKKP